MKILATSTGGFGLAEHGFLRWRPGPLIDRAVELAGSPRRPRMCALMTALGDEAQTIAKWYDAFSTSDVQASHLELFPRPNIADVRQHLLSQDVIWVCGGSVANLLAVWRIHGLDEVLRECWETDVVLMGGSAGSICWHVGGTTDSFGTELRAVTDGLGFLPYGNGVHYDSEERRRPTLHRLVGDGTLPLSYALDDGVALYYEGTELVEAVSDTEGAGAYRVERGLDGTVTETRIEPRLLADG
jgi:peptidase E